MDLTPKTRPELWDGVVAWTADGAWWQPWRLNPQDQDIAYAQPLFDRARAAAGVRLRVRTDAGALRADLEYSGDGPGVVDMLVNGVLAHRSEVVPGASTVHVELPACMAEIELWLPQAGPVRVGSIVLEGATAAERILAPTLRWVAYGSSITQCAESDGPSETWPALVARDLDIDLLCLGFGAQCHLDGIIPPTVAGLHPDLITLCLGINVYGQSAFAPRTWPGQVAAFILRVRELSPDADIVVISPVINPIREDKRNDVGYTLAAIRADVEQVVRALQDRGEDRLFLVSGLELLGPHEGGLLIDGVHPGQTGYGLMAERVAPKLAAVLGTRR